MTLWRRCLGSALQKGNTQVILRKVDRLRTVAYVPDYFLADYLSSFTNFLVKCFYCFCTSKALLFHFVSCTSSG